MKKHIVAALWLASLLALSCASAPPPPDFQEDSVLPESGGRNGGGSAGVPGGLGTDGGDAAAFEDPQDSEDGFSAASDGEGQPEPASGAGSDVPDGVAPEDPPADGEPDSPGNESALEAEPHDVRPEAGESAAQDGGTPAASIVRQDDDSDASGGGSGGSFDGGADLEEKVLADELPPLPEGGSGGAGAVEPEPAEFPESAADDFEAASGYDEHIPAVEARSSGGGGTAVPKAPEQSADAGAVPEASDAPGGSDDGSDDGGGAAAPVGSGGSASADVPEKAAPQPSRSMTAKRNQLIEIVYPGKGWIYQGSIGSDGAIDSRNRNFIFGGRKLGGTDQSFTLRTRQPGTYLLHFYKNDVLSGEYIDDYLEVVVGGEQAAPGERLVAPDYAEVVPPKSDAEAADAAAQEKEEDVRPDAAPSDAHGTAEASRNEESGGAAPRGGTERRPSVEDSSVRTVVQTTESAPDGSAPSVRGNSGRTVQPERNPAQQSDGPAEDGLPAERPEADALESGDGLLELARRQYDAGEYAAALKTVAQFFDKAVSRIDEGLYLQGQILEERSEVQNIKGAIDSYDLLVRNWPASALWDDANRRSIFLKRFYINIR